MAVSEFFYPLSTALASIPAGKDDYILSAGTNKNNACRPGGGRPGPMTHDDVTSYISAGPTALLWEQALNPDWPTGPIGNVTAMTLGQRYATSPGQSSSILFCNAAGTEGSIVASGDSNNLWATLGPSDAMSARPGGGGWSGGDMRDSTTMFLYCKANTPGGGPVHYMSSIWGLLTYTPPVGGFVFLLGLAGLLSLQMAGPMTDYAQFKKFLGWRYDACPRHTTLDPTDRVQAWDEYKSYTHPTFFFPKEG